MLPETVTLLNNLNQKFYDTFAASFAASRDATEPGLASIFENIVPGQHILDLGCGQGRVANLLPPECTYVGLDFSEAMITVAKAGAQNFDTVQRGKVVRFVVGDLLSPGWQTPIAGTYDWIILRAVLHHIPGADNRKRIIDKAAGLLAQDGKLVLANWQFLEIKRLKRRILPWETMGLSQADLDPGDYLLDWQRDGYGLRYVHWVDEQETRELAEHAGLRVKHLFRADGHSNNLTLYAVLAQA